MPRGRNSNTKKDGQMAKLSYSLVLNHYILDLFGCKNMEALAEYLRNPALKGWDENNVSFFYQELKSHLFANEKITEQMLLKYDNNIWELTAEISRKRDLKIRWEYFQYLSLLFTEIYLDLYFSNKEKLLADLDEYLIEKFNTDNDAYHGISPFTENDLRKLAFWSATGSGKTLLMHANILQYKKYSEQAGKRPNRILLVTPNEGLSKQHMDELELSNINAQAFDKSAGSMFAGTFVEVIETTKLAEENGDKTVAVDSFECNNLVLVDEGHRGTSGEKWKPMRDRLSEDGFSFEYSATFGQSIASESTPAKKQKLLNEYGKAIIFDYSYKYFYNDGYGKDYQILNLSDTWNDDVMNSYLTACLLNYFEQIKYFTAQRGVMFPFNIERPLMIFVGNSVTASKEESGFSDVVTILKFYQRFVKNNAKESIRNIREILTTGGGLVDRENKSIFAHSFNFLLSAKDPNAGIEAYAETLFEEILKSVFNCTVAGAVLHLDNLKRLDGEIGMRIGNGDYFGVINVGDAVKLIKLCDAAEINSMAMDFNGGSLFEGINKPGSMINVLIGSRKFSQGWNSWRVSTMGLLNIGRGEGSEIIQLFGRGVRLKGYDFSLKRSSRLDPSAKPNNIPKYLRILETLNIFGIRADYMEQFKDYLKDEGLPTGEGEFEEITLPVLPAVNIQGKKLKYIKVKDGIDFKKDVKVTLAPNRIAIEVILDYYPKIQILKSNRNTADDIGGSLQSGVLSSRHLSFVNWDRVYFDLVRYKNERSWYNLNISRDSIISIALQSNWYTLYIPSTSLEFTDFGVNTALWQEIITTLLKMYVERQYNTEKSRWMSENIEEGILDASNPNFEQEYKILVHRDLENVLTNLKELKGKLRNSTFRSNFTISNDFEALYFSGHLYQPLLYIDKSKYLSDAVGGATIEIKPVALNKGELDFVEDLKSFYLSNSEILNGKQLYLLRNQSRKGIGFFDANNFYPDFILWIVDGEDQYVSFIDPKGVTHIKGFSDPKVTLSKVIRSNIEPRLNDDKIKLNSYIIANTKIQEVEHWIPINQSFLHDAYGYFNERHVYFQSEQKSHYVENMIRNILETK